MVVRRGRGGASAKASYALGLFFIFLVACIWAGASVLIQYIYSGLSFESPFILTMICTSLFSLYLPYTLTCARLGWGELNPPWRDENDDPERVAGAAYEEARDRLHRQGHGGQYHLQLHEQQQQGLGGGGGGGGGANGDLRYTTIGGGGGQEQRERRIEALPLRGRMEEGGVHTRLDEEEEDEAGFTLTAPQPPPIQRWSHVKTFKTSMVIFPLFFIANFSYNVSLAHTSVTSNTIISTTSSLWTFLFSTCRGLEKFAWPKLVGLLLAMGGTTMVGLSDQNSGTDSLAGDALCLFAAIMYGVYTTALRVLIPDDTCVSFQLLFGYVGALSLLTLLPLTLIFTKAVPSMFVGFTPTVFGFIVINGLCDNVLSDYLWARSIVLTSPTVATVGLSLTIPLAFLSDAVLGKAHGGVWQILGAVAVACGFVLVSYNQKEEVEEEEAEEARKAAAVLAAGGLDGGGLEDEEDENEEIEVAGI